jgi:hypothetical protein
LELIESFCIDQFFDLPIFAQEWSDLGFYLDGFALDHVSYLEGGVCQLPALKFPSTTLTFPRATGPMRLLIVVSFVVELVSVILEIDETLVLLGH